jgi:hypothetical protein
MYIYMYIYIYTYVYLYTHIHTYVFIYINTKTGIESLLQTTILEKLKNDKDFNETNLDLIKGMSTTIDYMCMAINRFVDYSKSACGIKLIPTLVPFNTSNCLKQIFERINWEGANPPDVTPFPIGTTHYR